MTDFETFILDDCDGKIFRMYKYKKVWTPFELEQKYSDESQFENGGYAICVMIVRAIELPDKDILLKVLHVDPDEEEPNDNNYYTYVKLSEIVLEEYDSDNERS